MLRRASGCNTDVVCTKKKKEAPFHLATDKRLLAFDIGAENNESEAGKGSRGEPFR